MCNTDVEFKPFRFGISSRPVLTIRLKKINFVVGFVCIKYLKRNNSIVFLNRFETNKDNKLLSLAI